MRFDGYGPQTGARPLFAHATLNLGGVAMPRDAWRLFCPDATTVAKEMIMTQHRTALVCALALAAIPLAGQPAAAHVRPRESSRVAPPAPARPGLGLCLLCWLKGDSPEQPKPDPEPEGDQDCDPETGAGCVCTQDFHCFESERPGGDAALRSAECRERTVAALAWVRGRYGNGSCARRLASS